MKKSNNNDNETLDFCFELALSAIDTIRRDALLKIIDIAKPNDKARLIAKVLENVWFIGSDYCLKILDMHPKRAEKTRLWQWLLNKKNINLLDFKTVSEITNRLKRLPTFDESKDLFLYEVKNQTSIYSALAILKQVAVPTQIQLLEFLFAAYDQPSANNNYHFFIISEKWKEYLPDDKKNMYDDYIKSSYQFFVDKANAQIKQGEYSLAYQTRGWIEQDLTPEERRDMVKVELSKGIIDESHIRHAYLFKLSLADLNSAILTALKNDRYDSVKTGFALLVKINKKPNKKLINGLCKIIDDKIKNENFFFQDCLMDIYEQIKLAKPENQKMLIENLLDILLTSPYRTIESIRRLVSAFDTIEPSYLKKIIKKMLLLSRAGSSHPEFTPNKTLSVYENSYELSRLIVNKLPDEDPDKNLFMTFFY